MRTSRRPSSDDTVANNSLTDSGERVSTGIGIAVPPSKVISFATVLIVLWDEFGSGGNEANFSGSEVVFAATTTYSC